MSSLSLWHSETGSASKRGGLPKHRCSQAYINPHHAHPLFVEGIGTATQAALLLLLLNRVSHVAVHHLLHLNHKAIEDMEKRICQLREAWVVECEKSICFGTGQNG